MRIGIVGTENSHARHFVRHLNVQCVHPGYRVTALVGGRTQHNIELAEFGSIDDVVDEPAQLIGLVNATIVCSRDGRLHPAQAIPLIEAGLPTLVGKPLACDVDAAHAILEAGRRAGVAVLSLSPMRCLVERSSLASVARAADLLAVAGPADLDSEYGGIYFYGIHVVEIALALLPGARLRVESVVNAQDVLLVLLRHDSGGVLLELAKPGARPQAPYRIAASGPKASVVEELTLSYDYLLPMLDVFVRMLESGHSPLSDEQMLIPIELLHEVETALAEATA